MDEDAIIRCIKEIARDFPPRSHFIEGIEVGDGTAVITVAPRDGFTGKPRTLQVSTATWDDIMIGMMRGGFMQKQFSED